MTSNVYLDAHLDEATQDIYETNLRESWALRIVFFYYTYKLECKIYGPSKTKIAPGLSSNTGNGVATFYEFVCHIIGPEIRKPSEDDIDLRLDQIYLNMEWIKQNLWKYFPHNVQYNIWHIHVDFETMKQKHPGRTFTEIDVHEVVCRSFEDCLEHKNDEGQRVLNKDDVGVQEAILALCDVLTKLYAPYNILQDLERAHREAGGNMDIPMDEQGRPLFSCGNKGGRPSTLEIVEEVYKMLRHLYTSASENLGIELGDSSFKHYVINLLKLDVRGRWISRFC